MKHEICRACECVAHCLKKGCIPITTEEPKPPPKDAYLAPSTEQK